MTLFRTFTDVERAALKLHGLDTDEPSQLSDSFVIGLRYAASVAAHMDCAHRCGVGVEVANAIRGASMTHGVASPDPLKAKVVSDLWAAANREPIGPTLAAITQAIQFIDGEVPAGEQGGGNG